MTFGFDDRRSRRSSLRQSSGTCPGYLSPTSIRERVVENLLVRIHLIIEMISVDKFPPAIFWHMPRVTLPYPHHGEVFIDNLLVRIHFLVEIILVERPCAMGV